MKIPLLLLLLLVLGTLSVNASSEEETKTENTEETDTNTDSSSASEEENTESEKDSVSDESQSSQSEESATDTQSEDEEKDKERERSTQLTNFLSGFIYGLSEELTIGADPQECIEGMENAWYAIEDAGYAIGNGLTKDNLKEAISYMGTAVNDIAHCLDSCGLTTVAEKIAEIAVEMDDGYGEIAETVKLIVHGVDVYDDVTGIISAWNENDYYGVGKNLGFLVGVFIE